MQKMNHRKCSCGKVHSFDCDIYAGSGAIKNLSLALKKYETKKAFVFADKNTYSVGGAAVEKILSDSGINYSIFIFEESPKPDEKAVGSIALHCPSDADTVIAIGWLIPKFLQIKRS